MTKNKRRNSDWIWSSMDVLLKLTHHGTAEDGVRSLIYTIALLQKNWDEKLLN